MRQESTEHWRRAIEDLLPYAEAEAMSLRAHRDDPRTVAEAEHAERVCEVAKRLIVGDISPSNKVSDADRRDLIEQARELYSGHTDDVEIYDDAKVSEGGDPGFWVESWVWVSTPDEGDEA